MIDAWGGWDLFQELLTTLNRIAQKYNVSIANVATRYILDKSAVADVIIGVRLGIPVTETVMHSYSTFVWINQIIII